MIFHGIASISANLNSVPNPNGTNFKDWKENVLIVLGCMNLDIALMTEQLAALTDKNSADKKRDFD